MDYSYHESSNIRLTMFFVRYRIDDLARILTQGTSAHVLNLSYLT